MKAVIIGAAGFIGKALWERLSLTGHDVVAIDVIDFDMAGRSGRYMKRDILSEPPDLDQATDVVFYLAQSPHRNDFPKKADHLFGVNTFGAIKAATAAERVGTKLFCYASSGNVYEPKFMPLAENNQLRRNEPYALSKVMAEEALSLMSNAMQMVSVRFFGVFGPQQRAMLPWRLFNLVQDGRSVVIHPSLINPQDDNGLRISFCYVDDAVTCMVRLAELALSGVKIPRALNVAGPEAISVRRFAEALGAVVGRTPIFTRSSEPRSFDLVADLRLLKAVINPAFTPFSDGIVRSFSPQVL